MNPANVRLLQRLRADLFSPHHAQPAEASDLPGTVTPAAQHDQDRNPRPSLFHQGWDATP